MCMCKTKNLFGFSQKVRALQCSAKTLQSLLCGVCFCHRQTGIGVRKGNSDLVDGRNVGCNLLRSAYGCLADDALLFVAFASATQHRWKC
eukprot:6492559-Amphidinium_carterae.2